MTETKIVVTFEVTIYEEWTDDLNDSDSDYFVALAEIYVQYFMSTLKAISTSDVTSTSAISFSTCRVDSFTQSSSSRRRRTTDSETNIDADFEVIYDILADADSSTTSGITSSAESAITSEIESSVESALQELVELTDEEDHTAGDTNFITEPDVTETEFEDDILSEVFVIFELKTVIHINNLVNHIYYNTRFRDDCIYNDCPNH